MKKILKYSLVILILLSGFTKANAQYNDFYNFGDYFDIKVGKSINPGEIASISSQDGLAIYSSENFIAQNLNINKLDISIDQYGNLSSDAIFGYGMNTNIEQILIGSVSQPSKIKINGRNYHGYAKFRVNDGKLICINRVELEDYLKGVLPKEMSSSFPIEALKAQAVASRSFAHTNKNKFIKYGYNLDDTTLSQVYYGIDVQTENTDRAVDETRGQYAYYNGQIAQTIFGASSGGVTESAKDAWGKHIPYMISQVDEYSNYNKTKLWELEFSLAELANKLNPDYSIGELLDIEITKRTESNRAKEIQLIGSNGTQNIDANKFRNALGNTKFKSTLFEIEKQNTVQNANWEIYEEIMNRPNKKYETENGTIEVVSFEKITAYDRYIANNAKKSDKIKFVGSGYGHGVGMSQYGAVEMAKRGMNYIEILKFYYPGIEIR